MHPSVSNVVAAVALGCEVGAIANSTYDELLRLTGDRPAQVAG